MKNNNQDIVKTLRQRSAWSHEPILKEAADEIERLRTEVDHWKEQVEILKK